MFSSKCFITSGFTFRSLINFEFIFVYGVGPFIFPLSSPSAFWRFFSPSLLLSSIFSHSSSHHLSPHCPLPHPCPCLWPQNSIRHNLSLHTRFIRVQNEGTGKSSWWMLNPEGGKTGKTPRRRAVSMDNGAKFLRIKGKASKKKQLQAPERSPDDSPPGAPAPGPMPAAARNEYRVRTTLSFSFNCV